MFGCDRRGGKRSPCCFQGIVLLDKDCLSSKPLFDCYPTGIDGKRSDSFCILSNGRSSLISEQIQPMVCSATKSCVLLLFLLVVAQKSNKGENVQATWRWVSSSKFTKRFDSSQMCFLRNRPKYVGCEFLLLFVWLTSDADRRCHV